MKAGHRVPLLARPQWWGSVFPCVFPCVRVCVCVFVCRRSPREPSQLPMDGCSLKLLTGGPLATVHYVACGPSTRGREGSGGAVRLVGSVGSLGKPRNLRGDQVQSASFLTFVLFAALFTALFFYRAKPTPAGAADPAVLTQANRLIQQCDDGVG
jgi:hypothetical protein